MKGNPAPPGGPSTSKPTWWDTSGCPATSAFFLLARDGAPNFASSRGDGRTRPSRCSAVTRRRKVMGLTYAAIVLTPGGVISWLVVGLIAGWLAGMVMRGGGFGVLGDIIVGLIGSFLGGVLGGYFVEGTYQFWGSIVVAFMG